MEILLEFLDLIFVKALDAITPVVLDAAALAMVSFGVWLGNKVAYLLKDKMIRIIVERAATFVEQTGKELGSEDKKAKAMELATLQLKKWRIKVDTEDLDAILEAFVHSFKEHYKTKISELDKSIGTS